MSRDTHYSNEEHAPGITLAIELSNPSASPDAHCVALFSLGEDGAELIDSLPIPAGLRSSDSIMVLVDTLCTKHQISPAQITRIIVSIGPGGYTALRISTTTAKVLGHVLGCDLIAVPSVKIAAAAIEHDHRPALIALASKNEHAHCSIASEDGSMRSVGVIDASSLETLGVRSILSDGHLPGSFVKRAEELGIEIHPIVLDARHAVSAADGIAPIKPIELAPIYAREPDAITQWRALGKGPAR